MTNDFQDSDQWGSGPQTAAGKQKVSDVTTKHGAKALERSIYGYANFRPSHIDMINRTMILLQSEPKEAVEFMRAASYSLALRYLAAVDSDDLPPDSVLVGLRLATNLYQVWDKAYKALEISESYDYEEWLSLEKIMETENDP